MKVFRATSADFTAVKEIVQTTIRLIYPAYYPAGAVDFFLDWHRDEQIRQGLAEDIVFLAAEDGGRVVGTGSCCRNELTRFFVLPQFQGRGYGSTLMDVLEEQVFRDYDEAELSASLPAYGLYYKRGYRSTEYCKLKTANGHYLCYHVMKKPRPLVWPQ